MTSYAGRHAQLYDIFYVDKPYAAEARFVEQCLKRHGIGPMKQLIDYACGTGRHALELEQLGLDVTGIDHSDSMLAVARARATAASARVKFFPGDLRALEAPAQPFDAATCLFDAIGYVVTDEALDAALKGIARSLRPGGLFVFEFWHRPAMVRGYDPVRVRSFRVPEGEIVRISRTELDAARNLARVRYTIYEHRTDGAWSETEETQTNRFFEVDQMAGCVTRAGLSPVSWYSGFSFDERLSDDTWHVVGVARRAL